MMLLDCSQTAMGGLPNFESSFLPRFAGFKPNLLIIHTLKVASINTHNYFLGQTDPKLWLKGWQNHWQKAWRDSRNQIFFVLWPANLAAEPVVNSVGTKSHGICAGKSYGRAFEAVMDKQN